MIVKKKIANSEEEKNTKKGNKVIWTFISLIIAIGSIAMIINRSKTFRMDSFWADIRTMNIPWLILALISMFGFIWFEGKALQRIAKALNIKVGSGDGAVYSAADVYFSAITPSASGGQPASAYFMIKDGMHGSAVAITLLFNLIFYCLALLSIAVLNFILFGNILVQLSVKFKLLYGIGFIILIFLACSFYLLINRGELINQLGHRILAIGEKIKVIKNGNELREKLSSSIGKYRDCADIIAKDRRVLIDVYLYNVLQRVAQLTVSFCVFMAWKKDVLLGLKASAVQAFVAVGSNSIPIPGGMGVADYMMINGFTHLLGEDFAVNMELICRGITFYGCVITGGIITIAGYFMRRKKKNAGIL